MIDLKLDDCLNVMRGMADDSVDAIVTDPPGGIHFMGKSWDHNKGSRDAWIEWLAIRMTEALRVTKPGARALVWAIPRTSHWTGMAIEDAGWIIEDRVAHLFGCLSEDTEILTDKGWERYRKGVTFGLVLAYNNVNGTFQWERVQETLAYDYDETAYSIRSGRTDQIVSRNHRCLVRRDDGYRFELAEDAAREGEIYVPVVEDVRGLFDAISLPQCDSGATEQGVFQGLLQSLGRIGQCGEEETRPDLSEVWQTVSPQGNGVESARKVSLLRVRMRGRRQDGGSGDHRTTQGDGVNGTCSVDGGVPILLPGEDVGRQQSCLEGRGDDLQDARELCGSAVRSLPRRVPPDGTQGRLRDGASTVRCPCDGPMPDEGGSRPSYRSRSDQQCLDEPATLREQSGPQTVRASRFTVADLATIDPIEYRGIVWCVRVPSGAFVARRNGNVFITGNSGFPKHKSKLKPACEDWWLARKPSKNVPPLNIDDCRVGDSKQVLASLSNVTGLTGYGERSGRTGQKLTDDGHNPNVGRWPANVALSCCGEMPHLEGCPVAILDEQGGNRCSAYPNNDAAARNYAGSKVSLETQMIYNDGVGRIAGLSYSDSGGASRFFYCSKASPKDRGEGNTHPTVKSTDLLSWLIRLISAPGDTILDPFAGSGTTGLACLNTGRHFIGIESDPAYHAIAQRRLDAASNQTPLFAG